MIGNVTDVLMKRKEKVDVSKKLTVTPTPPRYTSKKPLSPTSLIFPDNVMSSIPNKLDLVSESILL